MARAGSELLLRTILARTEQLKHALQPRDHSRGSSIVPLLHFVSDSIALKATEFFDGIASAEDELDEEAYLRSLQQLLKVEASNHERAAKYASEIDRRDLPVGLLYLVDSIVVGLLGEDFDPLIHDEIKRNYSTDSLLHDLQPLLAERIAEYSEERKPVVFNVPALDPSNAFYSPILVHEATHTFLRIKPLMSAALSESPKVEIERLARQFSDEHHQDWPRKVFENWLSEALCDCIATLVTGPGFLLAISAFSGTFNAAPYSTTHPYMVDRVALMIDHLDVLGWTSVLDDISPEMVAWFRTLERPGDKDSPLEAVLRSQLLLTKDAILKSCKQVVDAGLTPEIFSAQWPEIKEYIVEHIPAAETGGVAPSPWAIVLSAWLVKVNSLESLESLAICPADESLSHYVTKSIELAAVVQLWGEATS